MEDVRFFKALTKGDIFTKLSVIILGLGNLVRRQIIKGLIFLGIEAAYIYYLINAGIYNFGRFLTLGGKPQEEVWNEKKQVYEYTTGDNTVLMLLYGIFAIVITIFFIVILVTAVKSSYEAELRKKAGNKPLSFGQDVKNLFNKDLHKLLMTPPFIGIVLFTILPLIYMISMAFTSYSVKGEHLVLFNWVGFDNFKDVLTLGSEVGKSFWGVLIWTVVWAVLATSLNYILGMILGLIINRKATIGKSFWRFCFVLSIAVPQFVSLMIMRTMLQPQGDFNLMLRALGILGEGQYLPFFEKATWARITVIVINLWVGIPYTLLQVTGILQNIPEELYEAARVDGANTVTIFWKITLPYMLFVTTPYLITQFTGNINNFNVIYLLSGGAPVDVGDTAGKTDLLITWLYKLTVDKQYFNTGAVIGIITFIILSVVALVTYQRSGSYKNEEAFK